MRSAQDQARTFFMEGVAEFEAGRLETAQTRFEAALALAPGRPSILTNLGVVRVRRGRFDEAIPVLDEALAQEPQNVEARAHRAMARAEMDRPHEALQDIERVLELAPDYGRGWGLRGELLKTLGRPAEAIEALERAIALGSDAEMHRYSVAALRGSPQAPASPPPGYVAALFDGYADRFDEHLVGTLHYSVPERLTQPLREQKLRFGRALDLGCGTGLCAPWLAPLAEHLCGVDLSARMLARARARGLYQELHQQDIVDWLSSTSPAWDLAVAADVFIYLGALEPVFEALARALAPGALLGFTVEESEGEPLLLQASMRYAHSQASVSEIAARHGFATRACWRAPVREEQGVAVPGLYFWMGREGR
ncbi:tetratricopeptide repeat protein [Ramlibacter rhizophilus]|uniref:Tetratricopeptide repeat protein n=1 Tax=Ramlibacter rhizophilus TaxID=1781167 RepID=A0A4Z0BC57_9BURK|nr:tetratricopeptide repeat protein [Ramlibacter rhizophilus]TFY96270.1 tetratricopeptide repeat protein [Ramlibacter rhizophilus]